MFNRGFQLGPTAAKTIRDQETVTGAKTLNVAAFNRTFLARFLKAHPFCNRV